MESPKEEKGTGRGRTKDRGGPKGGQTRLGIGTGKARPVEDADSKPVRGNRKPAVRDSMVPALRASGAGKGAPGKAPRGV